MVIRVLFALMLAAICAQPAIAADTQSTIALRVIDQYLLPRYRALESATASQHAAWTAFCKAPAREHEATLVETFHKSADAWQAVDHIRTGPVSLFLRAERVNYWPEMRNATAKGLSALLTGTDPHDLDPDTFAQGSVAVQGFPALERLLYDHIDLAAPRACAVGEAIALNLATVAKEIVSNWTAADGPRDALEHGKTVTGGFTDGAEAARLLLTDLMTSFQRMLDIKLVGVMGDAAENAKPKAAENWRSARSKRNLQLDLETTQAMIDVFSEGLDPAETAPLSKAMTDTKSAFDALPESIGEAAADEQERAALDQAVAMLKAARDTGRAILPPKLNIVLGFNALDGD